MFWIILHFFAATALRTIEVKPYIIVLLTDADDADKLLIHVPASLQDSCKQDLKTLGELIESESLAQVIVEVGEHITYDSVILKLKESRYCEVLEIEKRTETIGVIPFRLKYSPQGTQQLTVPFWAPDNCFLKLEETFPNYTAQRSIRDEVIVSFTTAFILWKLSDPGLISACSSKALSLPLIVRHVPGMDLTIFVPKLWPGCIGDKMQFANVEEKQIDFILIEIGTSFRLQNRFGHNQRDQGSIDADIIALLKYHLLVCNDHEISFAEIRYPAMIGRFPFEVEFVEQKSYISLPMSVSKDCKQAIHNHLGMDIIDVASNQVTLHFKDKTAFANLNTLPEDLDQMCRDDYNASKWKTLVHLFKKNYH